MSVKTTVARLPELDSHQPSGVLVEERPSRFARGRDRDYLYVLVEVSGEPAGRNVIASQLAHAVRQAYYDWHGSVTAGLQNAIREANTLLYNDNRDSLPSDRRTAGISCLVLRGTSRRSPDPEADLFVAQAGPAAVYLEHQGDVTRFPDSSPWLDNVPAEDPEAAALGERRDVHVGLFHTQVQRGDTIVLVESSLASGVSSVTWNTMLTHDSTDALLQSLENLGAGADLPVMLIRLGAEGDVPVLAEKPDAAEHKGIPAVPVVAAAAPEATQQAPPPAHAQAMQWVDQAQVGERLQKVWKALLTALSGAWAALLTLVKRMMPGQPSPQEKTQVEVDAAEEPSVTRVKRQRKRTTSKAQSDLMQKILLGVAIAIPLVVAGIVLVTYLQRGQSERAEIDALWTEADSLWQQATQTTDQAAVRTLLTDADELVNQVLERAPDHAEAIDLQKRIVVLLDELNQVRRINWIAELNSYPADADLVRVIVEGVHVFVMDQNAGKVYHHRLEELQQALQGDSLDTVLVQRGSQIGNVIVGDLVDMAWMPTDYRYRKDSLVILESSGSLVQYDPATGELVALPVADSETWQDPRLIGGHTGRLYLLDATANKIWRYPSEADGYTSLPEEWLKTQVDLAGTEDMSIGDSIYLLYADGKIRKLSAGEPDAFDISDWDIPPSSPTAIFARPPEDTQWVYIADQGNSRIVQSSKDGQFERQFRLADAQVENGGDALQGVTSLFVDEIGGRAYFLSGQKLYLVILPD
jgi:hypothetical protein